MKKDKYKIIATYNATGENIKKIILEAFEKYLKIQMQEEHVSEVDDVA